MATTPIKSERLSKDSGLSRLGLPIPSSPYTPYTSSPLTPNGTKPRLGPRRQSRFTEDMADRTPAASISERSMQSMDYYWYGPSAEDVRTSTNTNRTSVNTTTNRTSVNTNTNSQNININNCSVADFSVTDPGPHSGETKPTGRNRRRTVARSLNCALHAVPCLAVEGIMGYAMRVLKEDIGSYMGIQAIILIALLGADIILDVICLFRAQKPWPTWGLVVRSICGIGYVAVFLVYVGLGRPFPEGYTYWKLSPDLSAPVVYILLCVIGLWNLLHIPVCRYQLGSTLLAQPSPPARPASSTLNNRTSFNPRFSTAGTEGSSISMTWRGWVRTRSTQCYHSRDDLERAVTREPSADRTLREQPGEEDEDGVGSSRVASSYRGKPGESEVNEDEKGRLSEETVRPMVGEGGVGK